MKISDLVLMSDVDDTLLYGDEQIPQRNIDALARFTGAGGHFGIATGRSSAFAERIVRSVPVNFPCVVYNGGALYDFATKEYLYEQFLPEYAEDYVREMIDKFPDIGALIVDKNKYHDVSAEQAISQMGRSRKRNDHIVLSDLDNIPEGKWYKVIFIASEDSAARQYAQERGFPGVRFVFSSFDMMEMLPTDCTKGSAIKELMQQKNIATENLVTIGDYYNDLEMIRIAGFSAVPVNAPDDLKAEAKLIVCAAEQGAVADVIEYLEKTYGN